MPTFDVVSEVDEHEVRNAVDQASREIGTRYDFRNSKSTIELKDGNIEVVAEDDMKLAAIEQILKQKLAKREVSLKSVVFEEPKKIGGDLIKQVVTVKQGLVEKELKQINKSIKGMKIKVTCQIQGDRLRISGKKRDDLQSVISFLKEECSDIELQFINFRD